MAYAYPKPKTFDLTKQQIKNLTKLADKLETVPNNMFDMALFFENDDFSRWDSTAGDVTSKSYAPECGTVACACGWGPAAGVRPKPREHWMAYAKRAFGADTYAETGEPSRRLWTYLFDEDQGGTPKMAARRIRSVLKSVRASV